MIQAAQFDVLNLLLWSKTKDAEKNRNMPKAMAEKLINKTSRKEPDTEVFLMDEDFETYWLKNGGG